MSFEHPNRNNESMIDVERDIMSRPSERNTTNLDLQRMKMILDIMGHPEQSFRVIHITGTNGKGSTARMAEAICRAYGMRTGLYTSPHLEHVNERIAIDGQQLSDDDFVVCGSNQRPCSHGRHEDGRTRQAKNELLRSAHRHGHLEVRRRSGRCGHR